MNKSILSAVLGLSLSTYAAPVYLTFEGNIASSGSSPTIAAPDTSAATIVMMADLSAAGYYTYNGTDTYLSPDYYGSYFQTDYVSSPSFSGGSGGTGGVTDHYGKYIDYYNGFYGHTYQGFELYASSADQTGSWNYVEVSSNLYDSGYSSFEIGQTYSGQGYAEDVTGRAASWYGTFTLTGISDTVPGAVPEPGTLALFGIGLVGLSAMARWRTTRRA